MLKNLFGSSETATSLPDPKPLIDAMHTVALKDTTENRKNLYEQFLKSWFWICVQEIPEGLRGMGKLAAGTNIPVVTFTNAKGLRVLPAFTDEPALANYDPNTPKIALPALEVFKMAMKLGVEQVVVNAFDPIRKPIRPGGTVMRREFEALANGLIPQAIGDGKAQVVTAKAPTQVQIGGCPTPVHPDVKRALVTTAARFPELKKIFRYRMRYVETGMISEVLGLVCDESARFPEIASALLAGIQPFLAEGQHVDSTVLKDSDMALMQKHGELIYEKGKS